MRYALQEKDGFDSLIKNKKFLYSKWYVWWRKREKIQYTIDSQNFCMKSIKNIICISYSKIQEIKNLGSKDPTRYKPTRKKRATTTNFNNIKIPIINCFGSCAQYKYFKSLRDKENSVIERDNFLRQL